MAHSLVTLAVFFVLGIALSERLPLVPGVLLGLIATLIVAGLLSRRAGQRSLAHGLVLCVVMATGCLRAQLASPLGDPTHFLTQNAFGSGRFELEVTDDPVPSGDVWRMAVSMRAIWTGDKKTQASGAARLVVRRGSEDQRAPAYGDVLEVEGTLASPKDAYAGPGTHLKDLWAAEGVHGVIHARVQPKLTRATGGNPLFALLFELRHRISGTLDQTHPPEVAAFIRTILLGLRDLPIAPEEGNTNATLADYRTTGTYHLLSISGTHVGILALILNALFGVVFRRKTAAALVLAALAGYTVLSGGAAPVVRASLMAAVFLLGQMLNRPLSVFTALATAALAILVASPLSLFLPGFQMSFLAVLAIAYLTPPLMTRFDYLPPYLNALVSSSLAATLGTAPVLALATGQLSLVAPVANLFVIPLFGIILPVALAAVAGSVVSPWIPFFFGAANYGFVTLFSGAVHMLAQVPYAAADVSELSPTAWVVYGLGLVILGDWHNLRAALGDRLAVARGEPDKEAEPIDREAVERAVKDLACLLPEHEDATDPLTQRLAAVRGIIRGQLQDLAPEFQLRGEGLAKHAWARALDPLTIAYLALSESYFLASRSPDKGPALLLLLKALEWELHVHLFGAIRQAAAQKGIHALQNRYPDNPLMVFLTSPPVQLTLPEQDQVLWAIINSSRDRVLKKVAKNIQVNMATVVADPDFFFEGSRFPLRLTQVCRRYYGRLDKDDWDWESVRRAREEILGPTRENLFEQIGRALSEAAAEAPYAAAVATGGRRPSAPVSRPAGGPPDPGPGAGGVQDVHRLEDRGQEQVGDDQGAEQNEHDGDDTVEIHADPSLKTAS